MSDQSVPQPQPGQPSSEDSATLKRLREEVRRANEINRKNRLSKGGKARRGLR